MTSTNELAPLLKRLKLGAVLNTLPERLALARREELDYSAFLQIILTDEINPPGPSPARSPLPEGRVRGGLPS